MIRRALLVLGLALAGLVILALAAAGGFAAWLAQADLKPILEREASAALGRRVSLGGFEVAWGNPLGGDPPGFDSPGFDPLGLEIRDLRVANAAWGSTPEMIQVGRFSALIHVPSLLRGVLRYERLRIADLKVVLERDPQGVGNWKFGGAGGDSGGGGFALVPKNRAEFPTLIDFAGENGLITYRTRGGNVLRIALDRVAIAAPDESSPVMLRATGAYNDVAARLVARTESYRLLRDADLPFGTHVTLNAQHTEIGFDGTMMEPLDFEGVRGKMALTARTLDDLLAIMGSPTRAALPLLIIGDLARDGDHWALTDTRGRLLRADFTGDLKLLEGRAAGEDSAPDDIALDLDFAPFNLDPILATFGASGGGSSKHDTKLTAIPLHPKGLSEINLTAVLSTGELSFAGMRLPGFALDGRLAGGEVTLKDLKFVFGGGTLAFDGSLQGGDGAGGGESGDLQLNAHLIKAQAGEIGAMLGGKDAIRGRLNGAATLRLQGATLGEGLKRSSGAALVTLAQGDVARSLVEQVSADLRSLFRTEAGRVKIGCLLAAMTLKDGVGTLSPLRLESDEAILLGGGTVDLVGKRLDLTLKTERDSTSFFALDLPIKVSGPFDDLSAEPDSEADQSWIEAAKQGATPDGLPKGLREMAAKNDCVR